MGNPITVNPSGKSGIADKEEKNMLITDKMHRRSSLMSSDKKDLVEHIILLEHNNKVLNDTLNQQAENFKTLLKEYQFKDISLLEKCGTCGANITLMASINTETNRTMLVKQCLKCGNYPLVEMADITDLIS